MTRRSFHRPGWTRVSRTRRPAASLRVKPRSWRRRREAVQLYRVCQLPAMRRRRRGGAFPRRLQQRPRCGASACRVARVAPPRPPRRSHGTEGRRPAPGFRASFLPRKRPQAPATTHQQAVARQKQPAWDEPEATLQARNNAARSGARRVVASARLPPT